MLREVECMKGVAQGHEDGAVLGVLLGDAEAERVAVEAFRGLLVGDPQQDVADARQVDHLVTPLRMVRSAMLARRRGRRYKLGRWPTRPTASRSPATRRAPTVRSASRSPPISTGCRRPTRRPAGGSPGPPAARVT